MQNVMRHATWIELSSCAFAHNVTQYQRAIGAHRFLAFVIKSNAYGHGIDAIASLIARNPHIHFVCTSTIVEALQAQDCGIQQPILVLYPDMLHDAHTAIMQNIRLSVCSYAYAKEINAIAQQLQVKAYIHIKIDTGMHRFGFYPHDILTYIEAIQSLPYLQVEGIFTHFSDADNIDPSYTDRQRNDFHHIIIQLQQKGCMPPYIHMANSSAATTVDLGSTNMVRVGGGLYGLWAAPIVQERTQSQYADFSLQPILRWNARIIDIKEIPVDALVGYAKTFANDRPRTIAFVPVGYFEGYHRRLSNCGVVVIHNQPALVIGRIAMNVITVDISDIPQARLYDSVTLIGPQDIVHPYTIATRIGSFNPREVTTRLSAAIARITV